MKRIRIITVFFISLFVYNQSNAQQADLDTLFNRLHRQFNAGFTDGSTLANVTTWYNSQNADGTWTDIKNLGVSYNYATIVGGYCPGDHLLRTNAMIFAYVTSTIPGNTY